MGLPIAQRLIECGHAVVVRDVDAAREALAEAAGAAVQATPAALAACASLVVVAVVDAAQTEEVLFGAGGVASGARPETTVMLCPTIGPEEAGRLAARLESAGLGCIEAPMSGGPQRARDGTMSLMLAGPAALIERHGAVIGSMSTQAFRLGPRIGDGARTKLVNNLLAATHLAAAAEAFALARRVGLDARRTLEVVERSSGQSWIASERLGRLLAGDAAPRAQVGLLAKDSALAMRMAAACAIELPLGERASAAFAAAARDGLAHDDDSALFAWTAAQAAARGS
jgi:3-hydroxyisobutyrate dehydrogenase-like beta-hydroxyacid dehydrogenase